MRIRPLALLALLAACDGPDSADDADKPDGDTGADTADTSAPDDSGDSGDTADTDPVEVLPHAWPEELDAADLSVTSCGSDDEGTHVVAPGPDLDGDGLPELAIGAPGHDVTRTTGGAVYFFRGRDVVDGLGPWDAAAVVQAPDRDTRFGQRVEWVGDRDGDGVDDLVVGNSGDLFAVSGADLLAGGSVAARGNLRRSYVSLVRWADVDDDGVDDWLFGDPGDEYGAGSVSLVAGATFTLEAFTDSGGARGASLTDAAGATLVALHEDWDGDGIPELATLSGDTLHVVGSAALLAGERYLALAALTAAPSLAGHQILTPGDIDGDGRDELLVFQAANKLCLIHGSDPTGDAKVCVRDEGLGPEEAVLGDDLDGDGVPEVWLLRDGWLVALDVGALAQGIELELARVSPPDTVTRLAAGNGLVWASPTLGEASFEAAIAWGYTAALTPERAITVRGGKWGGIPQAPVWRDVNGDGAVDLVLDDVASANVAVFDGAGLVAGGTRSWCEATWARPWAAGTLAWVDDVNGDGADDALHVVPEGDGRWTHALWSGPVAIGAVAGDTPLFSWVADAALAPLPGCDLDGDGHEDLAAVGDDVTRLYAGGAADAAGFRRLGGIATDRPLSCLPDVDGDGGDELATSFRTGAYRVYHAAQLDPATTLQEADAALTIEGLDLSVPGPLRAGDGGGRVGWWFRDDDAFALCLVDLAGRAGTVSADDLAPACVDTTFAAVNHDTWLDHANGDTTPDIMFRAADSVRFFDGASLGSPELLVYGDEEERRLTDAGAGPDLFGVGARAIWTLGDDPDARLYLDWTRLDVLFARPSEE